MVMPLIRAVSTGTIAFRTTPIPAVSGVVAGDLLVAILGSDETATVTPPSGWTAAGGNTATAVYLNVFTKVATDAEPANYSFTLPAGTTDSALATIVAVRAGTYDPTTPVTAVTVGGSTTAASAHTAPSVTPVVANSLLVSAWGNAGSGGGTYTLPAGMTEQFDRNDGWLTMAVGTEPVTGTAATGTRTASSTTAAGAARSTTWRSVSLLVQGATVTPASILNIGPGAGQNHFEVQVARVGAGAIEQPPMSDLVSGYAAPPMFTPNAAGTAVQFSARVDAPTTTGSSSSRAELREVDAAGVRTTWDAFTGAHEMHGRTKITATPAVEQGVIIAQLYNENRSGDSVVIRTQVFGTAPNQVIRLVARINGTGTIPAGSSGIDKTGATIAAGGIIPRLADPYVLGTEFEWKIRVDDGVVRIFYNDMTTPVFTAVNWPLSHGPGSSFKAGVYNTATVASETDDTRYGTTELRDFTVTHGGTGSTDFTGIADGSAWPAPWTRYTTGTSIVDVQGGRGRLVGGGSAAFAPGHQAALPLNTTDFDVTYDVTVTNVIESYFSLSLRANGQQANGFPTSGFFLRATIATGNLSFQRWITSGTSFQPVGAAVNPGAWVANVPKRFRVQLIGTALRAKVWDPAAVEPQTWNIDITDSALPGALGGAIFTYATGTGNTAVTAYVDNFVNNMAPTTPVVGPTYPTMPNQVGDPVVMPDLTLGGKTVLRYDVITETGQATGTRNASLFVPSDFTLGQAKKLALANHGMDGGGAGWPNDAWKRDLSWRLIDAGYVLIAPSFGTVGVNPNTHGNAMAQTQYARAHAYASARFQVSGTVLLGYSMGGGQVLVELHRQTVPGVRVGYIVSGLTDMGAMAGPSSSDPGYTKPALLTAYNATEATFPAAAAGYDPMVQPVSVWTDIRLRMNVSTGDTLVPQSSQGTPFRNRVTPAAAELVYVNTTGGHNSATQWESAATVATWLDTALAASTSLTRTLTDSAAITDSATAGLSISRTLTDSAAIVDAGATYTIGPGRNLIDNAAITDSATWRMQSQRTLTDRVATSDSASWTMTVPGIQDFQFQLLGATIPRVVLGRGAEIVVLPDGFDPAYGDLRTQDQNAPQGDYRRFGADKRSPGVWSFEAFVDAPNAEQALGWVDMCAEAWDAEYIRETPGAVMALQYKVAGRLRRIYGRPRNFQAPPGPLIQNGRVPVSMEFHRVEDVSYDDDEQGTLIRMGRSGEVRPSPWRFPLRFPTSIKTVAEPRTEQVIIGGRLRTWLVISIRGPVINPWVQIGPHRWQLTGEVPGGRTAHLSGLPWMQTVYMDDGSFLPETGNGVFRPDMLDARSRLAHLRFEPGQYAATFGGYDTTGSATAEVRWRNAYRGW